MTSFNEGQLAIFAENGANSAISWPKIQYGGSGKRESARNNERAEVEKNGAIDGAKHSQDPSIMACVPTWILLELSLGQKNWPAEIYLGFVRSTLGSTRQVLTYHKPISQQFLYSIPLIQGGFCTNYGHNRLVCSIKSLLFHSSCTEMERKIKRTSRLMRRLYH
jgi:hypothetical protein